MWAAYNNAKVWNCRPSQMFGIDDTYVAYCIDEAIASWGLFVTNELESIEGKSDKEVTRKRHNKLLQLLDAPDEQRFRKIRKPK